MYALMTNIHWLYTVHTINPYQNIVLRVTEARICVTFCTDIVHQSYEFTVYSNGCWNKISLTQSINQLGCIYIVPLPSCDDILNIKAWALYLQELQCICN